MYFSIAIVDAGIAMVIYIAKKISDANSVWFSVADSDGRSIPSCDNFLLHLRLRDCSVYTQRAYAIGLAHFFSWLDARTMTQSRSPVRSLVVTSQTSVRMLPKAQ